MDVSAGFFTIGANNEGTSARHKGDISLIRIFDWGLNSNAVQQLYTDPYCIFEPATKYTVVDERLKSKFVGSNTAAMQLLRGINL